MIETKFNDIVGEPPVNETPVEPVVETITLSPQATREVAEVAAIFEPVADEFPAPSAASRLEAAAAASEGPAVEFMELNVPAPEGGALQPAVVSADEVNAGPVSAEATVIGVNADELEPVKKDPFRYQWQRSRAAGKRF